MLNQSKQVVLTSSFLASLVDLLDLLINELLLTALVVGVRGVDVPNKVSSGGCRNQEPSNGARNHILRQLVVILFRLFLPFDLSDLRRLEKLDARFVHFGCWALAQNVDVFRLYDLGGSWLFAGSLQCVNILFLDHWVCLCRLVPLALNLLLQLIEDLFVFNLLKLLLHLADFFGRLVGLRLLARFVQFIRDFVDDLAGNRDQLAQEALALLLADCRRSSGGPERHWLIVVQLRFGLLHR